MKRPDARPGPHDGSALLVWPLGGVIAGLLVYLVTLAFPGVHNGGNVLLYVIGGALVGLLLYFWRRHARR